MGKKGRFIALNKGRIKIFYPSYFFLVRGGFSPPARICRVRALSLKRKPKVADERHFSRPAATDLDCVKGRFRDTES